MNLKSIFFEYEVNSWDCVIYEKFLVKEYIFFYCDMQLSCAWVLKNIKNFDFFLIVIYILIFIISFKKKKLKKFVLVWHFDKIIFAMSMIGVWLGYDFFRIILNVGIRKYFSSINYEIKIIIQF